MVSTTNYITFIFPGGSAGKESSCNERPGSDTWVEKIPLKRKWLPTPVFLLGEFHGQRAWQTIVHEVAKSWIRLSHSHSVTHLGRASQLSLMVKNLAAYAGDVRDMGV